jgi:hypothetical protein
MTARVLVLAEGITEQVFVRRILAPWLAERGIYPTGRLIRNVRNPSSADQLGGDVTVRRVVSEVSLLLRDRDARLVTTMIDYYGMRLPKDHGQPRPSPDQIVNRLAESVDHKRFLPYLQVHEFEALLYSEPAACAAHFAMPSLTSQLSEIVNKAGGPEEIDNDPNSAPARRLKQLVPGYDKRVDSVSVLGRIGIPRIRERCPRFDGWLSKLEALA